MGKYDHLLHSERPVDLKHKPMSLHNRAAQFAPFDALTGFGGRIHEASRLTDKRIELTDEIKQDIDAKLRLIAQNIRQHPVVTVTFFVPDLTKDGGAYREVTAVCIKLLQDDERLIVYEDAVDEEISIAFDDILSLQTDLYQP